MVAIGASYLTLADLYKSQYPDGSMAPIIELLAKMNPILDDALAVECNNGTKHFTTVRTGLPSATWRKLYEGVQPTKSTRAQVEDTTGMLEAWSEVDSKLVKLSPNPAEFRLMEAMAFIEGLSQQVASAIFYESTAATPERMLGLTPRFNSTTATGTGPQVIKAGSSDTDNTSIWFVVWGENTCHLLYPKGTQAGINRNDIGEETKVDSNGAVYRVMREQFTWDIGLSLRDYRYVARVCNIDVSLMLATATGVELLNFMIDAYYALYQRRVANGRLAIYCNREVKRALHKLALNKVTNSTLSIDKVAGQEVVSFLGAPIRECDAILNNEPLVT